MTPGVCITSILEFRDALCLREMAPVWNMMTLLLSATILRISLLLFPPGANHVTGYLIIALWKCLTSLELSKSI